MRARAAANNHVAQRRIRLREQSDQKKKTDHRDHDHAAIPRSGGIDSEDNKIAPIYLDRGRRHTGEIVAAVMHAVYAQKTEDSVFLPACANLFRSTCESRAGEGASRVKHPTFNVDRARGRE